MLVSYAPPTSASLFWFYYSSIMTLWLYRQCHILAALIRRPFITSQAFFSVNMNALREQY